MPYNSDAGEAVHAARVREEEPPTLQEPGAGELIHPAQAWGETHLYFPTVPPALPKDNTQRHALWQREIFTVLLPTTPGNWQPDNGDYLGWAVLIL